MVKISKSRTVKIIIDIYIFNKVLPAVSYPLLSRSSMLVEVVVSLCLYYLRSYYPALPGLATAEVRGNREIQLAAVSLLAQVGGLLVLVLVLVLVFWWRPAPTLPR